MSGKINFEVQKISQARKADHVVIELRFFGSPAVYTYVRKAYEDNTTLIDGCRVYFNEDYEVLNIIREYETKGIKKTDTSNISKSEIEEKTEEKLKTLKTPKVKKTKKELKNVKHEKYEEIKVCIESDIPVYLYGPAGSGKNYTLQEISKDLGLDFYFTNSVQQEYKITGFIDAGGIYHETEFYKAFTQGGLFFLDEMDASIPEVLVLLNAAIANRYFEFPNGKADAHEDFRVVAAGNTVGSGADEQYVGRLVLDQATLDRFVLIEFDYDKNIELKLAKGNEELVEFIRELRKRANDMGIRTTFSYRAIITVTKLEGKLELKNILAIAVYKGLEKDTITILKNHGSTNRYMMAS